MCTSILFNKEIIGANHWIFASIPNGFAVMTMNNFLVKWYSSNIASVIIIIINNDGTIVNFYLDVAMNIWPYRYGRWALLENYTPKTNTLQYLITIDVFLFFLLFWTSDWMLANIHERKEVCVCVCAFSRQFCRWLEMVLTLGLYTASEKRLFHARTVKVSLSVYV